MIAVVNDYGHDEIFSKTVKAKLFSLAPNQNVVEISEQLDFGEIYKASDVLERFASYMGENVSFLVCVNGFNESSHIPIAMVTKDGKRFVGFDNGVFTSVIERFGIRQIRRIDMPKGFSPSFVKTTFDILIPTIVKLASGMDFSKVGELYMTYYSLKHKRARLRGNSIIEGEVAFINGFGSVETNVPFGFLKRIGVETGDRIKVNKKNATVIFNERDGENEQLMVREGMGGYVEIFSRDVKAAGLLKIHARSEIRLEV